MGRKTNLLHVKNATDDPCAKDIQLETIVLLPCSRQPKKNGIKDWSTGTYPTKNNFITSMVRNLEKCVHLLCFTAAGDGNIPVHQTEAGNWSDKPLA